MHTHARTLLADFDRNLPQPGMEALFAAFAETPAPVNRPFRPLPAVQLVNDGPRVRPGFGGGVTL